MSNVELETNPARKAGTTARVASAVIHVSDMDHSVDFYCDVFSCVATLRDSDAALLLTPDGFQIYLYAKVPALRPHASETGVQYLMWATDREPDLRRITQRLLAYDAATYTHVENGVTFVEARDPDHGRVIVAYPGPGELPRTLIAPRFRGR